MTTIALIEDDPDLRELLRYNLEKAGYRLVSHSSGKDAIVFLQHTRPELLILDIMLPHTDGLDICQAIRNHPHLASLPIIFLTAKGAETDRVLGFELGANDYLVKPFFMRELMARVQYHLRHHQPVSGEILAVDELTLDRSRLEVSRGDQKVSLTATEFRLLEFLMTHPGRVCNRGQLLDQVWGRDRAVTDRAVDVCVLRLRQKLEEQPTQPKWIHSVRGFGYTFDPARAEQ